MGKFAHYSTEQQHDIQCGDNHRNGIARNELTELHICHHPFEEVSPTSVWNTVNGSWILQNHLRNDKSVKRIINRKIRTNAIPNDNQNTDVSEYPLI